MSNPPPPPRRRNAPGDGPIVVYPGNPPAGSGRRGGGTRADAISWSSDRPRGSSGGPARPQDPRRDDGDDHRRRWLLLGGGLLVVLLFAGGALLLAGGGGDDGPTGPRFEASTNVDLQVGEATVEAVGLPLDFPADVRDQVLATTGAYVDAATVTPLRKGAANEAKLAESFDPGAAARLAGPERPVLVDEGFPKAVGEIDITTPPVALTGLMDREGNLVLVTAIVDLQISARVEQGRVKIQRAGSFVFAPDGTGAWKISGWTLIVNRSGPGVTTTTIASTPTTTPA